MSAGVFCDFASCHVTVLGRFIRRIWIGNIFYYFLKFLFFYDLFLCVAGGCGFKWFLFVYFYMILPYLIKTFGYFDSLYVMIFN